MMYGYYGSDAWSGLWALGMHVHVLFALVLLLSLVAAVIWMARFAKEAQLKKWFWMAFWVGLVGMLLTAPLAYLGMRSMMENVWGDRNESETGSSSSYSDEDGDRYRGMMDWWYDEYQKDQGPSSDTTDSSSSSTETNSL